MIIGDYRVREKLIPELMGGEKPVYPTFDLSKLNLKPLAERKHDMHVSEVKELGCPSPWKMQT